MHRILRIHSHLSQNSNPRQQYLLSDAEMTALYENDRSEAADAVITAALAVLEQYVCLLMSLRENGSEVQHECTHPPFVFVSKMVPGSTVGKHFRHMLDHFRLLISGVPTLLKSHGKDIESVGSIGGSGNAHADPSNLWLVDYDIRERNVPIERDIDQALKELRAIQDSLSVFPHSLFDHPVMVRVAVHEGHDVDVPLPSTFGRELWFAVHHATHHAALIRVICLEQNIQVAPEFGIAPSTLRATRRDMLGLGRG
ncbi:hypothetical protein BJ742DRAFT_837631 [Cladochytrium replicatum]|nr:hypothetical protein BJ742DRAFT_837631 [Cladochytrium replicatum]